MSDTVLSRDISREALIAELRALRPAFEREGVEHMALVGSRARRDNREDSDVDLMIDVVPGRRFSLVEVARIVRAVEDGLGLQAHVLMQRSLRPDMLRHALKDRVPVF